MSQGRTVLLTGGSGFLGKVILEELFRRRVELDVERVILVIRPQGSRSAAVRFRDEVVPAACFSGLPKGWDHAVTVIEGDLTSPGLGLDARGRSKLDGVTEVIHSAASVNFNLPVQAAARANITASLHLLEIARRLPLIKRFVYVSTAYVTPHPGDTAPVEELLIPLPQSASSLFEAIDAASVPEAELLARTGHPNTYTFTKAIAEHLVVENAGTIPVSIVRPSIISASRVWPFPGWIDSTSGFGAFATLIGLGHLRAVVGRADSRLDLIPVDDVSHRVVGEAVGHSPSGTVRHATAGVALSTTSGGAFEGIRSYFKVHPIARRPARAFLGPAGARFQLADALYHRMPIALAAFEGPVKRRQAKRLASRLEYLNAVFPYFTTRTFDFRSSVPLDSSFDAADFVRVVCRGLARHVLEQDEREWILAGRDEVSHGSDIRWAMRQPRGNAWVRLGCYLSSKLLRRVSDRVTVDLPSFERARRAVPADAGIVLLPTHRSYLDFILVSHLMFARPDLGIRVPHVAAAMEFGRIPLVGRLMRAVHAFYVQRGPAKENRALGGQVNELLEAGEVLEFFIEGQRSRSRAFLPPKRGLLRLVQASGRRTVLLPIAICYDRIPEEDAFRRELAGQPRAQMRIGALLDWLWEVARGRVQLGRMHIACADPVLLDESTDLTEAGQRVIDGMRSVMAVSDFHIAVLAGDPTREVTVRAIKTASDLGEVRLLRSALKPPVDIDPLITQTVAEHCEAIVEAHATRAEWALERRLHAG